MKHFLGLGLLTLACATEAFIHTPAKSAFVQTSPRLGCLGLADAPEQDGGATRGTDVVGGVVGG